MKYVIIYVITAFVLCVSLKAQDVSSDYQYYTPYGGLTYTEIGSIDNLLKLNGVLGQNIGGLWSMNLMSIPIIISNMVYIGWWTFLGCVLVFITFLFWLRRVQIRKVQKEENKRLIEVDNLRTRLYTKVAHDFRTPITVIMGMAEQILVDKEALLSSIEVKNDITIDRGQKIESRVGYIKRNADSLLGLINQMNDLLNLDSNTSEIVWESGDAAKFLSYISDSFHSHAETQKVKLTYFSEMDSLIMDFDRIKLQKIISNLLSNAIGISPPNGKVLFHVYKKDGNQLNPKGYLCLKISNPGTELLEGQHSGRTEIGLALTKELIKLLGGEISVSRIPGKEAAFRVQLPIRNLVKKINDTRQESITPIVAKPIIQELRAGTSVNFSPIDVDTSLVLIVEDNADVAAYIRLCLEDQYKIVWAENGQQGIDLALQYIPDIIISDVMMPMKDGYEVTQFLKSNEKTSHIPIILLTGKSNVNSRIEGIERGADVYLTKPFDKKVLIVRVTKLIELRKKLQNYFHDTTKSIIDIKPKPSIELKENVDLKVESKFLLKVQKIFEEELSNSEFDMQELNTKLGMSHSQVYRKVKALTGMSTISYFSSIRLSRAKDLLKESDSNVSEVCYLVGFSSPAYFTRKFTEEFGYSPSHFKSVGEL